MQNYLYRLVCLPKGDTNFLEIRGVEYNAAGEVVAFSDEPIPVRGRSVGEIKDQLRLMHRALKKEVIDIGEE